MIRELIQQIELQKLAEQDPEAFLDEITKLAFFDELEQIKEANALKDIGKGVLRFVKGQPKPRTPLKMSFPGHAASAPKPVVSVNPATGGKTVSTYNPMTQGYTHATTRPAAAEIPQSWAHNPTLVQGMRPVTA